MTSLCTRSICSKPPNIGTVLWATVYSNCRGWLWVLHWVEREVLTILRWLVLSPLNTHFQNFIYFLSFFICGATYWSRHWWCHWSHHLFIYFCHHSTLVYSTLSDRKVPILFFLNILSGKVWFVLDSFLIHLFEHPVSYLGLSCNFRLYIIFAARFHSWFNSSPYDRTRWTQWRLGLIWT